MVKSIADFDGIFFPGIAGCSVEEELLGITMDPAVLCPLLCFDIPRPHGEERRHLVVEVAVYKGLAIPFDEFLAAVSHALSDGSWYP